MKSMNVIYVESSLKSTLEAIRKKETYDRKQLIVVSDELRFCR